MKRQVSFTDNAPIAKKTYKSAKRYPKYRNLDTKFERAISYCTRSGYVDYNIASTNFLEIGVGCSGTGLILTQNSATELTTAWAGASDIPSLYDAYRIVKMELTITFNQNTSNVNDPTRVLPWMYVVDDYNDINTGAGSGLELYQKPSVKQIVLGRNSNKSWDYKRSIVPKVAQIAYAGTVSGYLEPKAKQWVNTSAGLTGIFTDVHHYGFKVAIDPTASTSTAILGRVRFFVKCYFELKNSI